MLNARALGFLAKPAGDLQARLAGVSTNRPPRHPEQRAASSRPARPRGGGGKLIRDAADHRVPASVPPLAKQPDARIPGAVRPVQQPAPIARIRQPHPSPPSHSPPPTNPPPRPPHPPLPAF